MTEINWINFGKYGVAGQLLTLIAIVNQNGITVTQNSPINMAGEWTSFSASTAGGILNTTFAPTLVNNRFGIGIAFYLFVNGGTGTGITNMTLPGGSISRIIGGFPITPNFQSSQFSGFMLSDGVGSPQIAVDVNSSGFLEIRVGGNASGIPQTITATSANSMSGGTTHWIDFDIIINNSTGAYTIDVDNTNWLTATNVNTRGTTSNNSASVFSFFAQTTNTTSTNLPMTIGESLYLFNSAGSVNNAIRGNSRVNLSFTTADSSVTFSTSQGVVGYYWQGSSSTNAPGANELVLIPITPEVTCTLNSVTIVPQATNAGANFKPVLYPDNSGKPDGSALTVSGSQVTGCVAGTPLTLALTSGETLTGGTKYWIGYITDTSVVLSEAYAVGDPLLGRKAANTYTSGAPATCPTTTANQATWEIFGNTSGQSTNYSQVNLVPPPGALSYLTDSTVSAQDFYTFQSIPTSAGSIAGVKLSAFLWDSDAGARTVNLEISSSGSTSGGSNVGFTPGTTPEWINTFFETDPKTTSAWVSSGVSAALAGPLIVS